MRKSVCLPWDLPLADSVWLAMSDLDLGKAETVEFLASAKGTFAVWLNGRSIFARDKSGAYQPDSDRFSAALPMGRSRIGGPDQRRGATGFHFTCDFAARVRRPTTNG